MLNAAEQFSQLSQAGIENFLRFAQISLESAERLARIQAEAAKSAIEDSAYSADQALEFGCSVYRVAAETRTELLDLVERSVAASNEKLAEVFEQAAGVTAPGADVALSMIRAGLTAGTKAFESAVRAGRQAGDYADATVDAAVETLMNVVKKGS